MIKKILPFLVLVVLGLLIVPTAVGQSGVTFSAQSTTGAIGDEITFIVTVDDFIDVVTFQGSLQFDPAILEFVGSGSHGVTGLGAGNFGAPGSGSVPDDRITYAWYEPDVQPVSLNDGSVLFSLTFDVIGGAGASTSLSFVSSPTTQEVGVDDGGLLTTANFTGNDAQITIESATDPAPSARVADGLQVLYTFEEGSGTVVHDVSGVGAPLNLTFLEGTPSWIDGALSITSATTIASGGVASKVIDAVKATGEITIEAWVKPDNDDQGGPARIVSLSKNADPDGGNFMLGQDNGEYEARFRSTNTNQFGKPGLDGDLTTDLQHVIFTRHPNGERMLYVDGELEEALEVGGDLSNWGDYVLSLANEVEGKRRPWLGEMHLVAIYNASLTEAEITQNFEAGPHGTVAAPLQYSLGVSTTGSGSVDVTPQKTAYDEDELVTLTATADVGWTFAGWSGDLTGAANPAALVMDGDKSVVATFVEAVVPTYSLTINTTGNGSVGVSPQKSSYDEDEQVTLTATPEPGWVFDGWSGDLTGAANPAALTMDEDKTVTAAFTEAEPSDFAGVLVLSESGEDPVTLHFGTAADATDGTDASYDAILPPAAHTGFDARFTCMDGTACSDDLSQDFRTTIGSNATIVWSVDFRRASSSSDVLVDWSGSALPSGYFHLIDRNGLDIDMSQIASYSVTDPSLSQLLIVYSTEEEPASANVDVASEWNLVGPPLFVADNHFQSIFPGASVLFGFDPTLGYTSDAHMSLGKGYWAYFGTAGTEVVTGYPIDAVTLHLAKGWQLISGPSCSVDFGDFIDPQGILVPGSLFGVDGNTYVARTTLSQGDAAWVKTSDAGVVTALCSGSASKGGSTSTDPAATLSRPTFELPIHVSDGTRTTTFTIGADDAASDAFDADFDQMAPPPPPTGILDARVRGDRIDYFTDIRSAGTMQEFTVRFQPSAGRQGVTLTWNPTGLADVGEFIITDGRDFGQSMTTTSSLNTSGISALRSGFTIRMQPTATVGYEGGEELPEKFVIHGNFPNPFNPSTRVAFDLPQPGLVSVDVFDVMGRLVLSAPEMHLSAGTRQSIVLDASSLSSGSYVYRVVARLDGAATQSATGLMTLLK